MGKEMVRWIKLAKYYNGQPIIGRTFSSDEKNIMVNQLLM